VSKKRPRPGPEPEADPKRPGLTWTNVDEDPWHADSSLPASDAISGLPEVADEPEPEEEPDPELEDAEPEPEPESPSEPRSDGTSQRRRSKTIARKQMLRERRRLMALGQLPEVIDYERPVNRTDCRDAERPCLYVSCRYHLYLDVNPTTGSIKINFPEKNVWDLEETCALDVAERGGVTLEEVGDIMNLTRERIRQVEVAGLEKLRTGEGDLETFLDGRELPVSRASLPIVDD
jgi:hypothetical protein